METTVNLKARQYRAKLVERIESLDRMFGKDAEDPLSPVCRELMGLREAYGASLAMFDHEFPEENPINQEL
jgi:hypothetical protein